MLVALVMFYLWHTRGRDPEGRKTAVARYRPPEKMAPTMIGSLIDEGVHDRDITAGIISLAEQGFIQLVRHEEPKLQVFNSVDYELKLNKSISEIATEIEKGVAEIIFNQEAAVGGSVRGSELKEDASVAKGIKQIKKDINKRMVEAGYFTKNPRKVSGRYTATAAVVAEAGSLGNWPLFLLVVAGLLMVLLT